MWKSSVLMLFATLLLGQTAAAAVAGENEQRYDQIRFTVTVEAEIDNDLVRAVVYAQREGTDAAALAREVNAALAWGLDQAKAVPAVKAQTLGYQTSPIYTKQTLTGWRVRQSVRLESEDAAALSNLIGALQQRLAVQSIDYDVSPKARKEAEDRLIVQAVDAFRQRADLVAKSWGQPEYRLVEMRVNTQGMGPVPMARMAMAMEMQAPEPPRIEAGTQTVRVAIEGAVELKVR